MQLIDKNIALVELIPMAKKMFGNLVKATVDSEKEIMVIDAQLHADQELFLLEQGSQQKNLWGINLHPTALYENFIEFDSMINLRPSFGNCSRGIDDPIMQERVKLIVNRLVIR